MKALKVVAPRNAGEINKQLTKLRNDVQEYLLNGIVSVGDGVHWSTAFRPSFGICGNSSVPNKDDDLKKLMAKWSRDRELGGSKIFPIDRNYTNFEKREDSRWDQSTKWGRNRLALLDWLIIETAKLEM